MLPTLFKIGPLTVRTYGLLLAAGFALAIWLAVVRGKRRGLDPDLVLDLGFYVILGGILGARIAYVLHFPAFYLKDPLAVLRIWEGGLVFYGGLAGAMVVGVLYLLAKRTPVLKASDLAAPSIALGQAVGRLGCFAAGCCYGTPYDGACAVTFSDPVSLAPPGIALHPTQLYLSAANAAIFGLLLLIDRRRKFDGQTFFSYLLVYPAVRFVLEFLRGDERGSFLGTFLSPAQGIALLVVPAALLGLVILSRRARR